MLVNRLVQNGAIKFGFVVKKKSLEVTIRTPYKTICENDTDVTRLIFKDLEGMVCLQNRMPGSLYVLPPGMLKIRGNESSKVKGDYVHLGGWGILNEDNSCEFNFMDVFKKEEIQVENIGKGEKPMPETIAGKYLARLRQKNNRSLAKSS